MAGTVDLPLDFTLGSKFQIASPAYEQAFVSVDGDPNSRDVVAVERDSNGDLWGFRQLDLSLTKYFDIGLINDDTRIWVRADVLNVFNDRNYNGFDAVTGERNYNNLSTDGFPRTLKVSAGFEF